MSFHSGRCGTTCLSQISGTSSTTSLKIQSMCNNTMVNCELRRYDIKGNPMRISTISMFLKGIEPRWEDKINTKGGEFQMRLHFDNEGSSVDRVNQIWESLVLDLVAKRFPHSE